MGGGGGGGDMGASIAPDSGGGFLGDAVLWPKDPGNGGGGGDDGAVSPTGGPGGGGCGGGTGGAALEVDGIGGDVDGVIARSPFGVGAFSSMADRGRGGPMVPNSSEASCFALLPPVGRSSSSSEESAAESTTDHSSSSGRTREGRAFVAVDGGGKAAFAALSCCARRWKGLVDTSIALGDARDGFGCTGASELASLGWLRFLKNGFFVSMPWDEMGAICTDAEDGEATDEAGGEVSEDATSLVRV
jgi:hypothetical protein